MERVLEIVREMKPELKELPLFLDDTPDMTISYIVDRLFHLVSGKKISCRLLKPRGRTPPQATKPKKSCGQDSIYVYTAPFMRQMATTRMFLLAEVARPQKWKNGGTKDDVVVMSA